MVGAAKVPCLAAEFFRIHSFSVCFTCSPSKPEACLPYSSRSPQSEKAGPFGKTQRPELQDGGVWLSTGHARLMKLLGTAPRDRPHRVALCGTGLEQGLLSSLRKRTTHPCEDPSSPGLGLFPQLSGGSYWASPGLQTGLFVRVPAVLHG